MLELKSVLLKAKLNVTASTGLTWGHCCLFEAIFKVQHEPNYDLAWHTAWGAEELLSFSPHLMPFQVLKQQQPSPLQPSSLHLKRCGGGGREHLSPLPYSILKSLLNGHGVHSLEL